MKYDTEKQQSHRSGELSERSLDLRLLLHPSQAYAHPRDVVGDADLTTQEKRAILASWASDACAVEAAPALRLNPAGAAVSWDDIMDALRELDRRDKQCSPPRRRTHAKWTWHRWRGSNGDPGGADRGSTLN